MNTGSDLTEGSLLELESHVKGKGKGIGGIAKIRANNMTDGIAFKIESLIGLKRVQPWRL